MIDFNELLSTVSSAIDRDSVRIDTDTYSVSMSDGSHRNRLGGRHDMGCNLKRWARTAAYCLAMLAVFALATPVFAQETTGTIRGRVVDAQGLAVPGASVTVTGVQGVKSATTDAEGRFSVPFLTPGVYTVRGELQGFKAVEHRNVTVSLGQAVDLPLRMDVGGVTETVQVTGSAPIIDPTSTTTGAVLSSEMFSQVPVGRRLSDTLYMAPGVSTGGASAAPTPQSRVAAASRTSTSSTASTSRTRATARSGRTRSCSDRSATRTPFDFVKEVQVKTGGYEAEFGQSTGGVVNVVTKSGSNDLRGSLFGYARPTKTRRELDTGDLAERHDQHR